MAFKNFTTDPDDLPLYKHISFLLSEEIRAKHKPGDTLPSEQEMAKRYKVHRNTLRRAIEELVNEGIVGKLQGRGTIVKQKLINYSIHSNTRFTDTLEKCGRKAETVVLRKRGIPAQGDLVEILKLQDNEPVACIETLRKMDDLPFSVVTHYIPLEKAYDLIRLYKGGSLHLFLLERYAIKVRRTTSMIQATLPEKEDIKTLSIMGNSPILLVKSINVDQQTEEPMELAVSRFKGTSTQLIIEPK
ncbi:MAG: phosphonate metabolism transcriptional regulator PhnF [Desulfopila sp.]